MSPWRGFGSDPWGLDPFHWVMPFYSSLLFHCISPQYKQNDSQYIRGQLDKVDYLVLTFNFFFLLYLSTGRYRQMYGNVLACKICIYKCVADGSLGPVHIPISVTTSILKNKSKQNLLYIYIYIKDCGLYTTIANTCANLS